MQAQHLRHGCGVDRDLGDQAVHDRVESVETVEVLDGGSRDGLFQRVTQIGSLLEQRADLRDDGFVDVYGLGRL
jgi:hypothetical protein